jgi:hypothetical protein
VNNDEELIYLYKGMSVLCQDNILKYFTNYV